MSLEKCSDDAILGCMALPQMGFEPTTLGGAGLAVNIYPYRNMYQAEIIWPGDFIRVPIDITANDLLHLNQLLQQQASRITSAFRRSPLASTRTALLKDLADLGQYVFTRIFTHAEDLTSAIRIMEQDVCKEQPLYIQFISQDFFVPWELLCSDNENGFWGTRYVLSRCHTRRGTVPISPVIYFEDHPQLGLLTYEGLEAVKEREIPFFLALNREKQIVLRKLRPLNAGNRDKEIHVLKKFCNQSFELMHFACHATHVEDLPDTSYITLSDDFRVSLIDLEIAPVTVRGNPLVVLNACETGKRNPVRTADFVAAFLRHGARGVIATECEISDDFAASFTEKLYLQLLTGRSLGESLLQVRRYFLECHDNPMALFYSMYASAFTRLQKV